MAQGLHQDARNLLAIGEGKGRMILADEILSKPRRIRSKRRVIRPMGAWEIYEPDPDIRREEQERIDWTRSNRRRYGKA